VRQARALARRFGYRNLAYLTFVAALIPLERIIDRGLVEPEDGGGRGLVLALWMVVSAAFFLANAALAVIAGGSARPIVIPMIACALPVLCLLAATAVLSGF
jgi:hypothetical protein